MNTELLRPLVPSQLKPECSSPRESAVLRLREVGVVRITQERTGRNGDAMFTVSVSLAVASSCPTGRRSEHAPPSCGGNFVSPAELQSPPTTPTEHGSADEITVTKRLEDFAALRTKVYSLAGTSHKGGACAFCTQALRCALWSESQYFHRNAAALSGLRDDKLLTALVAILSGLVKVCTTRTEHESNGTATSPRSAKPGVSCYDECASPAKLPALTPTAMEPECASERGRAVLALSTIDAIRVTRHPTRESFVVEVFTGSGGIVSPTSGGEFCEDGSHIPTRLRDRHASIPMHQRFAMTSESTDDMDSDDGALCKRMPAVTFEKQLGEFTEFRDALYNATLPAHSRVLLCEHCREVIEYALWAHKVPAGLGLRMLFHREQELDKVTELLSAFLSELLARTLSPPCIERAAAAAAQGDLVAAAGVPWCRAQSSVPVVVHAFLMQT